MEHDGKALARSGWTEIDLVFRRGLPIDVRRIDDLLADMDKQVGDKVVVDGRERPTKKKPAFNQRDPALGPEDIGPAGLRQLEGNK